MDKSLEGIFVFVNKDSTKQFKVDLLKNPEKYYNKIVFVLETKEIITHGTSFGGTEI